MDVLKLTGRPGNMVEIEDTVVRIRTKIMREKEKTIPFSSIISVQLKKPAFMTGGYIYFQTVGGLDNSRKTITDIAHDENSWILANIGEYEIALKMKERIEAWNSDACNAGMDSSADEILKFKNLLDVGAITQEEFNLKKKQLLGL